MQLVSSENGEAIHLHPAEPPVLEIKKELHRIEGPPLASNEMELLLQSIWTKDEFVDFRRFGLVCFDYRLNESTLFQMMVFRENGDIRLEIRRIQ